MRRRSINIASAISFVLCVGIIALWVRSYWTRDIVQYARDWPGEKIWVRRFATFYSDHGGVEIDYLYSPSSTPSGIRAFRDDPMMKIHAAFSRYTYPAQSYPTLDRPQDMFGFDWAWFGFELGYFHYFNDAPKDLWQVQLLVPDWLVTGFLALPAVWCLWSWKVSRRQKSGHCSACGYDLRATPERCPECGLAVKGAVQ